MPPEPNPSDDILDNVVAATNSKIRKSDMPASDIDTTSYEELVEEDLRAVSMIVQEHQGNADSEFSLVNHSGGKKFAKEDAIEAASIEMILQLND